MDTRCNSDEGDDMGTADKLNQLIDDSEELLIQLTDSSDPQIQVLRNRIDKAIVDTRRELRLHSDGDTSTVQIREIAATIDDYVRDFPWLALATGVLVAAGVGFVAGMTSQHTRIRYV
jgi:ElaB/YqjD/DUF883 family membrane-anchored ribosome-binding protein